MALWTKSVELNCDWPPPPKNSQNRKLSLHFTSIIPPPKKDIPALTSQIAVLHSLQWIPGIEKLRAKFLSKRWTTSYQRKESPGGKTDEPTALVCRIAALILQGQFLPLKKNKKRKRKCPRGERNIILAGRWMPNGPAFSHLKVQISIFESRGPETLRRLYTHMKTPSGKIRSRGPHTTSCNMSWYKTMA